MKKIFQLGLCTLFLFNFIDCKKGTDSPPPLPVDGKGNLNSPAKPTSDKPSNTKPANGNGRPASGQPSPVASNKDSNDLSSSEDLTDKFNNYVGCINSFSESVLRSYRRYTSWCNKACEKNGPTGKETYITYGLYQMSDPSQCLKKIQEANAMRPSLPEVEKAASAYGDALKNLYPVVKEAYEYYDQKNYQDDQGAKGQNLHPKLLAGWRAFVMADHLFQEQIDILEDKNQAEEVARLEKSLGRTFPFLRGSIMIKAKAVLKAADAEKMDEASLSTLTQKIEDFEKVVNELNEYVDYTKHPERKEQMDKVVGSSSFISSSKDFLKAAKGLMRHYRDKTKITAPPAMTENGMIEGTIQNVLKEYNELIRDSNNIHYLPNFR